MEPDLYANGLHFSHGSHHLLVRNLTTSPLRVSGELYLSGSKSGKVRKKGLEPEDYDASRWNERILALQGSSSPARARFDVALTICTMCYVSDLRMSATLADTVSWAQTRVQRKSGRSAPALSVSKQETI
jgi:hypothetical protein